jgi:hypothetical protein
MLKFLKRFRRRFDEQEPMFVSVPGEPVPPLASTPPARQPDDVSLLEWLRLVLGHLCIEERLRLQQRVVNSVQFGDAVPQAVRHALLAEGGQQDGQWAMLLVGIDEIDDVERQGRELARAAGIAAIYGWSWHEGRSRTPRAALFELHTWLLGFGFSLLQMDTGRPERAMLMTAAVDAEAALRLGNALGARLALPRSD